MPLLNWGLLDKSQTDAEKIEAAITRLITEHNADETAHLGVGESLASHKAAEIIDHLAASIIADKIARFSVDFNNLNGRKVYVISNFESLDGWNYRDPGGHAPPALGIAYCEIGTTTTANDYYQFGFALPVGFMGIDFDKNCMFQTPCRIDGPSNQLAYIIAGDRSAGAYGYKYFGFKVVDGTLYAVHNKGTGETTTEIVGYTLNHMNVFRAEFSHGVSIKFYINETLVATHTTNLPAGLSNRVLFSYYIKTTENLYKNIASNGLFFTTDRDA